MRKHYLDPEKKESYSLRKVSVGLASVIIGSCIFLQVGNIVSADTTTTAAVTSSSSDIQLQEKPNQTLKAEIDKVSSSSEQDQQNQNITESQNKKETTITTNSQSVKQVKNISKDTTDAKTNTKESNSSLVVSTPKQNEITKDDNNVEKQPDRVSVHDPSIFQDPKTGKYYVFGSHQAEAESDDLYNWTPLFKKEYEQPSYIFDDYDKDLAPIFKWAGNHDGDVKDGYAIWAPDEVYNPGYKWDDGSQGAYMYYFSASSSWIHSAIGFAVSKTVHGPYQFKDTIIYSGFTKDRPHNGDSSSKNDIYTNTNLGELIKNGTIDQFSDNWIRSDGTYNNDYAPNAIDVNIVTDKDNNLWMSYGSWSGGIYLLPLNKETGLPIYPGKDSTNKYGQRVDRYFGTHLLGGFHESGEAPYIKYDKNTGYYYLFTTYGGLTREGGYNIRLFRSKEIDGKYTDAMGQHPIYTKWITNDATKQENQKYGIKLEGNYDFSCLPYSYMSPGHNSVFVDKDGNWFLVNHTRFDNGTEFHQIRVKSMIMTSNGWPIPLPFEYTGNEKMINQSNLNNIIKQIPGKYEFVNNGTDTSGKPIPRANIELTSDNRVQGDFNGNWTTEIKDNHIYVNVKDDKGNKYVGEFKLQQDESNQYNDVLVFAALGDDNEVIWGEKNYIDIPTNPDQKHDQNQNSNDGQQTQNITDIDSIITSGNTSNVVSTPINTSNPEDYQLFTINHNAYLYNKNGDRILNSSTLKIGTKVMLNKNTVTIKEKKFYQIKNKEEYIAFGNVTGRLKRLTRNSFVYNNKGIRIKKAKILKKGKKILIYGSPVKIKNTLFYSIGNNQFIKVHNFK